MVKKLHNWTFKDVEVFLKTKGFILNYTNGSHYYYIAQVDGRVRNACVPFHGNKGIIKTRTLKGIISQSGIDQKEWLQ
ncbi:MAG: type II toxin-antitoxin system HicA family toxin [Candidatus Pacebacteria bacterium]|nr:type II toxin-antitoxin system HicA family toxin [Candidatus Paceibacterota bacterium]MCD8528083.1 type II toxin-antitoxin system HicA family toxin [Candidatus Paceibacterota bacterium]MCD8564039.1 type II toxin-antitoxin system HicA family toxin [Candidatus Paceibacterota bacterium]